MFAADRDLTARHRAGPALQALLAGLLLALCSGCIRSMALNAAADALSSGTGSYATDDDPELIEQAVPFGLKTMESVLSEKPEHRGLLLGLASGFTQYSYAFLVQKADRLEGEDLAAATALRTRAKKLCTRGRDYGLRGLSVAHEGFAEKLRKDANAALAQLATDDVPLAYWTAAAWGLAIASDKNDPAAIADLPLVIQLAQRALTLDEAWNRGALHELFITLSVAGPNSDLKAARQHAGRALALSQGTRAGTYVSLAEGVSVREQNAKEFHALLDKALAVDLDESPNDRLANVIMQRRARWLKGRSGDLFLEDASSSARAAARPRFVFAAH